MQTVRLGDDDDTDKLVGSENYVYYIISHKLLRTSECNLTFLMRAILVWRCEGV